MLLDQEFAYNLALVTNNCDFRFIKNFFSLMHQIKYWQSFFEMIDLIMEKVSNRQFMFV